MNCGNCAFWEPLYITLGPYANLGQCTVANMLCTHPACGCITGNWCPRPTLADLSLEVKESGKA